MFSGHDTTTSGMCWTLYLLAKHPEHQRECQREINELMEGRENRDLQWWVVSGSSESLQVLQIMDVDLSMNLFLMAYDAKK